MNLFLTSGYSINRAKTCSLPGRLMELQRFCPYPEKFGTIVPYSTCSHCEHNTNDVKLTSGVINSAKYIESIISDSKLVLTQNPKDFVDAIVEYSPSNVFIESLTINPTLLIDLANKYPARYIVRVHSNIPFLVTEPYAMKYMTQFNNHGIKIAFNNYETYVSFSNLFDCLYLPNLYEILPNNNVVKTPVNTINIGCFGAMRPFKNHLLQAITAIEFADSKGLTLNFHINGNTSEPMSESILANLQGMFEQTQHNLIPNPWMDYHSFLKFTETMHIGMQFSLTESFNIVTADCISRNVPVAVSDEIKFVDPRFKANPVDSRGIIRALSNAFDSISNGEYSINKQLLEQHNNEAIRIWKEFLHVTKSS